MFDAKELNFIFGCIEAQRSQNTETGIMKADLMKKICVALDNIEKEKVRAAAKDKKK